MRRNVKVLALTLKAQATSFACKKLCSEFPFDAQRYAFCVYGNWAFLKLARGSQKSAFSMVEFSNRNKDCKWRLFVVNIGLSAHLFRFHFVY